MAFGKKKAPKEEAAPISEPSKLEDTIEMTPEQLAAEVAKTMPAPPKVVTAPKVKKYRVRVGKNLSWHGSITHFPPGTIIEESSYGGGAGIARLKDSGLDLEEID